MDDVELPLFPLNVVLFPGSALPLHIFEERYRLLIRECLANRWPGFGINFVRKSKLSAVGCTAVVREVVQQYPDGRCDIVAEGQRRYELHGVDEQTAPYIMGRVSFFSDDSGEIDRSLEQETVGLYNNLLEAVYSDRLPKMVPGGNGLSFTIAQKAGMSLPARQHLLETRSENGRLDQLRKYLRAELPRLQQAQEVQRIAHNDGYILP